VREKNPIERDTNGFAKVSNIQTLADRLVQGGLA
jgi:hypothetical protein